MISHAHRLVDRETDRDRTEDEASSICMEMMKESAHIHILNPSSIHPEHSSHQHHTIIRQRLQLMQPHTHNNGRPSNSVPSRRTKERNQAAQRNVKTSKGSPFPKEEDKAVVSIIYIAPFPPDHGAIHKKSPSSGGGGITGGDGNGIGSMLLEAMAR
jgi:hypothetical protein